MNKISFKSAFPILAFLLVLFTACTKELNDNKPRNPSLSLWYDQPAKVWTEALPLGNGRIGAMVYGKAENEIIQFNEETLWTGQPHNYSHQGAFQHLDTLRQLLLEGKQAEAHKLGNEQFMSQPIRQLCYQPFGNITLNFPGHENYTNYRRELDIEDAISSVSYTANGVNFKREAFISAPDQAILMPIEASEKGALNFTAGLNSPHSNNTITVQGNELVLRGKANDYVKEERHENVPFPESKITFEARLKVIHHGGELVQEKNTITIKNARKATLILVAATNFISYHNISADPNERCINDLSRIKGKSFKSIKSEHITDYQELFSRVEFDLVNSEISHRPTNLRIDSFEKDEDPSLVALLYQYGRYLLISSSRPGSQPANLQGIWNNQLSPKWDSKYTLNINTEMNYWPAEITNLAELTEPLIKMVEDLSVTGKVVARDHYNMSGWMVHHNTDIWRGASPINNANHGVWPVGSAWLCQHLWWHYQFSGDKEYLKNKAYPLMRGASQFYTEYLVPHPKYPDYLVSGPSNSPEQGGMVMGPTMDHQIIRNLFSNTIEAAEILEIDADFVQLLQEKKAKIAPNQIGQYGQLQEWMEDVDNPTNQHRHVSHLWGLHPGNEIHPSTTPDLAEACKTTLKHRGDGGTGWSRAWKINFWARLLDGDHSFLIVKNLITPTYRKIASTGNPGGLYPNLFDAHPPFQIDGNFGATSGITEMLLQSHLTDDNGDYILDILPALPSALPKGKISGIKARNGFELSIEWVNGKLVQVAVKSILGNKLNLRYDGKMIQLKTEMDKTYYFKIASFINENV